MRPTGLSESHILQSNVECCPVCFPSVWLQSRESSSDDTSEESEKDEKKEGKTAEVGGI